MGSGLDLIWWVAFVICMRGRERERERERANKERQKMRGGAANNVKQ